MKVKKKVSMQVGWGKVKELTLFSLANKWLSMISILKYLKVWRKEYGEKLFFLTTENGTRQKV